jgi:peptidyl-dipeptidase Dcp
MADDTAPRDNPLLEPWTGPFALPPFDRIAPAHFLPAFHAAFAAHRAEIARIAADPSPPDFANTLDALESAGRSLERVGATFWHLASAHTNPELQAVEREVAPLSARHWAAVQMDAGLFARIDRLHAAVSAGMDASDEQRRVLDLLHRRLVRAGARLDDAGKTRLADILERLAALGTRFGQNLLADEAGWTLALETPEMLAGLPAWLIAAAERCGAERGRPGVPTITLARAMVEPFLQFSAVPALRARAYEAWIRRGETGGDSDNRALVAEILALRDERARLLGYASFAALRLDGTMAGTPASVHDLLDRVWPLARARALAEHAELVALARAEDPGAAVGAADWRFWAARLARTAHDLDPAEIKPYLQLDNVIAAAFDVATRLFGLRFAEVEGLALHHPDARAWEVRGPDGRHLALFVGDYFARPSKRSGAWMTGLRGQRRLGGETRPIILNVLNLAKGAAGAPALLGLDDARTVFHEFGHALHGMMSDVVYPSIAGTAVPRDFVEFPSQLYEHWLMRPEVLGRFARHATTGAEMPPALIARLNATRGFGQGFATVEFVASAIVDMEFHARGGSAAADPMALESEVLARIGMPAAIAMRHRTPHFAHVFSGEGYAAGYYSYLWSEVLDADGFAAFEEAGDVFDPALAARLRDHVYAAGNRRDPAEAYRAFRGRDPDVGALLAKRGLAPAAVSAARS